MAVLKYKLVIEITQLSYVIKYIMEVLQMNVLIVEDDEAIANLLYIEK